MKAGVRMSEMNTAVAVYPNHAAAEAAIRELQQSGI